MTEQLDRVAVTFKTVRIGSHDVSIGIDFTISDAFDHDMAEDMLLDSRCDVVLDIDGGQQTMDGFEGPKLSAVGDFKGYSRSSRGVSTTLAFKKSEVNLGTLTEFVTTKGFLTAKRTGAASASHEEQVDPTQLSMFDGADDRDLAVELSGVGVSTARCAKLAENGIRTIGELQKHLAAGNRLDAIKGIGDKAATEILATVEDYLSTSAAPA